MGIMTSSGAVLVKAGAGVSSDLSGAGVLGMDAETIIEKWITEGESIINVVARNNYSDSYAALNVDVQGIMSDFVSNHAAIYAIQYDLDSYPSRIDAEDKINVLRDAKLFDVSLMRDKKQQDFVDGA